MCNSASTFRDVALIALVPTAGTARIGGHEPRRPVASPCSAATASRSPAPTASTPTPPTRRCSPPRIDGLVARFGLEGERLGEVVAGAVLKHSRDFNLTRESVLGSKLAPETPATDLQQACGTGLQAADRSWPTRSPSARSRSASPAAPTPPPTRPIAISEKLRKKLMKVNAAPRHRRAG